MKKVGIIVLSPYQIFNAIYMKMTLYRNDEVDLYIADYMPHMIELNRKVRELEIFKKVYVLSVLELDKKIWKQGNLLKKYLYRTYILLRYYRKTVFQEKKYDLFLFSFENIAVWFAGKKYRKCDTQFIRFEDGAAEYAYESNLPVNSKIKNIYFKIFGISEQVRNTMCLPLYVHSVELAKQYSFRENLQLPPCTEKEKFRERLNELFGWHEKLCMNKKVIYFGSDGMGDLNTQQLKVCELLHNIFGKDFIVKMHPKQTKKEYDSDKYSIYEYVQIPWELNCLNENMNEKILLSISSTACFTPYILFKYEPTIILLYKFLAIEEWNIGEAMDKFVEQIRKCYKKPERIIVPKTYSELESVIVEIRGDLCKKD